MNKRGIEEYNGYYEKKNHVKVDRSDQLFNNIIKTIVGALFILCIVVPTILLGENASTILEFIGQYNETSMELLKNTIGMPNLLGNIVRGIVVVMYLIFRVAYIGLGIVIFIASIYICHALGSVLTKKIMHK